MDDYDFFPSFADDSFNFEDFRPNYSPSAFDSSNVNTDLLTPSGVDESFLDNLTPEDRERYAALQREGTTNTIPGVPNNDFAVSQERMDEFNKYNPTGDLGNWQTVGTNKVMIHDDGTASVLDPTTNQTSYLTEEQVQALVKNGTLNSRKSGYVSSTLGKGNTPGGSKVSLSGSRSPTGAPSTAGLMALMAAAMAAQGGGGGGVSNATIPDMSASRSQTDYGGTRPGSANVDYFTPTTYTPKAAGGGLMDLAASNLMNLAGGGMSHLGGYSDGGRLLRGPGDGVSDSIPATIGGRQPARLATGEFVVPARIVSELGNGATEAGANKLYAMMDRVQQARRNTKNIASDTKAHKYLPA